MKVFIDVTLTLEVDIPNRDDVEKFMDDDFGYEVTSNNTVGKLIDYSLGNGEYYSYTRAELGDFSEED